MDKKDCYIRIRLTEVQEEAWKECAKVHGISMSEWLRKQIDQFIEMNYDRTIDYSVPNKYKYALKKITS